MDNQHRRITGYRELTTGEIAMMNRVKALEAEWNRLIDDLRATPGLDARQLALAATDAESTFMRAVRAIARPSRQVAPATGGAA